MNNRPTPHGLVEPHVSPIPLDNIVAYGQAETCSFFFGRVKGLKDPFEIFWGNTHALIFDLDVNALRFGMAHGSTRDLDLEHATFLHGLYAIHDQVEQQLTQLTGVAVDGDVGAVDGTLRLGGEIVDFGEEDAEESWIFLDGEWWQEDSDWEEVDD